MTTDGVASEAYFETRQVGDAAITVINDGDVILPLDFLFSPAAIAGLRERGYPRDEQTIVSAQLIIHVALGDSSIVIDPAFDYPGTPWERAFAGRWLGLRRTPGLAAALDAELQALNIEYASKRSSGRLKPLEVRLLGPGAGAGYRRWCVSRGQRDAQFKVLTLQYARECAFDFEPWLQQAHHASGPARLG